MDTSQTVRRESGATGQIESLLNEYQVANLLSMSVASIRRYRLLKRGPKFVKLGAAVRYRREDLFVMARISFDRRWLSGVPVSFEFTPWEIWSYYAPLLPQNGQRGKAEYRGPCPVHKGRNNNFVVEAETGLSFCFSKCNRGWDMIGLDQELFGGDFKTARQRVFAAVVRQWHEPSAAELARLAEPRQQDRTDERLAIRWCRGLLQHLINPLFAEPVTPEAGERD